MYEPSDDQVDYGKQYGPCTQDIAELDSMTVSA